VQAENEHDILLIISAFGIFLYASYTIIAGIYVLTLLEKVRFKLSPFIPVQYLIFTPAKLTV
jgi:hypothetical protein